MKFTLSQDFHPVPYNNSYWVSPGLLLAGQYPRTPDPESSREKLRSLLDTGVRTFVNLTFTGEGRTHGRLQEYVTLLDSVARVMNVEVYHYQFSIVDMGLPSPGLMDSILDTIDESLTKALPVYVHCWGGYGRTGTAVGCWLIRHGLATGDTVLDTIAALRKNIENSLFDSPQTPEQKTFVQTWS